MIYLVNNLLSEGENSPYRKQVVLDRKSGNSSRELEEVGGGSTSETGSERVREGAQVGRGRGARRRGRGRGKGEGGEKGSEGQVGTNTEEANIHNIYPPQASSFACTRPEEYNIRPYIVSPITFKYMHFGRYHHMLRQAALGQDREYVTHNPRYVPPSPPPKNKKQNN